MNELKKKQLTVARLVCGFEKTCSGGARLQELGGGVQRPGAWCIRPSTLGLWYGMVTFPRPW